jgi:iron(III) transport system substrate-binding protein
MEHLRASLKFMLIPVLALSISLGAGTHAWSEAEFDEWLEWAELGPFQPEIEDWDAILEAAREEPPITIHVGSSRIHGSIAEFNEQFGLQVESLDFSTNEVIERTRREFEAGNRHVGAMMVGNIALQHDLLLDRDPPVLVRYVPRDLEAIIDPTYTEPLLWQRMEAGVWYVKTEDPDGAIPYDNLWELTTEEWRGRVAVADPMESGTVFDIFTAFVTHADEMERLYEEHFGEPITLSTPNAGYEWIARLFDNDVRMLRSMRDVAEAVSAADGKFVGLSASSIYRQVIEGVHDFELDRTVNPSVLTIRTIGIASLTDGPNQAKLVIRWLTSQEGGAPWWAADFPTNPEIEPIGDFDLRLADFDTVWVSSLEDTLEVRDDLLDFLIVLR